MPGSTVEVTLFAIAIPLRRPFRTATGTIASRPTVLVRVDRNGAVGWGEAAPFPGQDESVAELIECATTGRAVPTLAAAVDEAIADADARRDGRPLLDRSGLAAPACVAVGVIDAVTIVDELFDSGVQRFKVKVTPDAMDHVVEIRERHPGAVIGVDGNGSFGDLDRHQLGIFHELGLAFAEELFAEWATGGAEMFTDMTGVPLFADESVRSVDDAARMLALPAVSGITIKPGRLGWRASLTVRDRAIAAGKAWRASGLLETGIGRSYTDALAADETASLSDVAPADLFLVEDVVAPRWDGSEPVPTDGPGIGVAPDMEVVGRYLVDDPIEVALDVI